MMLICIGPANILWNCSWTQRKYSETAHQWNPFNTFRPYLWSSSIPLFAWSVFRPPRISISRQRRTCARTTIHFHPFFILLSADPDEYEYEYEFEFELDFDFDFEYEYEFDFDFDLDFDFDFEYEYEYAYGFKFDSDFDFDFDFQYEYEYEYEFDFDLVDVPGESSV